VDREPTPRPRKRTLAALLEEENLKARSTFFRAVGDLDLETVEQMLEKKVPVSPRLKKEEFLLPDLDADVEYIHQQCYVGLVSEYPAKYMYNNVLWNMSDPKAVPMFRLLIRAIVARHPVVWWKQLDDFWDLCDRTRRFEYLKLTDVLCSYGAIPPPIDEQLVQALRDVFGDEEPPETDGEDIYDDDDYEAAEEEEEETAAEEEEEKRTVGQIVRSQFDAWQRRRDLFYLIV